MISRHRVFFLLLLAIALFAAVAGTAQLLWHGRLFAGRAGFPLDLEWMEGGMLVHAQRIARGDPLYVRPSVDFIPFLYTPLYPALLALLSKLFPLGYLLGRLVSIVAFLGALALLAYATAHEGRGRGRIGLAAAALVAIGGAGAIAAGFEFSGAFYDLVRSDALLLFLQAAVLVAAFRGTSLASAAAAGVLIALAFFTKQTASVMGVSIGIGLLVASWRRGLVYGAAAAATLAIGVLFLTKSSEGWFWTYVFKLHQSHPFRWDTLSLSPKVIWRHEWVTFVVLVLSTVGLSLAGQLRRRDAVIWSAALGGVASGIVGFATMWAWPNAYMPTVYFPVFAAAVLTARLLTYALDAAKEGAVAVACVAAFGLGLQNVQIGKPDRARWVPQAADRAAAARFIDRLRALPGDGFIPFHPYYATLVGKRSFAHRMGVMDVAGTLGRPDGLDQAIAEQRFPFVVLDWKSTPGEWPSLETRYRVVHEFRDGVDAVRSFSGAETSPRFLLLPVASPPPLPDGGVRLADFESSSWDGWIAEGAAFGVAPAPAPPGHYGRFAADSGHFGVAARGTLRSPSFKLEKPYLRFSLSGSLDSDLRVLLLHGPETTRATSPSEKTTVVQWEVDDLVGKEVVLVIEDQSETGALVVDEVVAY